MQARQWARRRWWCKVSLRWGLLTSQKCQLQGSNRITSDHGDLFPLPPTPHSSVHNPPPCSSLNTGHATEGMARDDDGGGPVKLRLSAINDVLRALNDAKKEQVREG